jgi:hypothetical protein
MQALRFGENCSLITNTTKIASSSYASALKVIDDTLETVLKGMNNLENKNMTHLQSYKNLKDRYNQLVLKRKEIIKLNSDKVDEVVKQDLTENKASVPSKDEIKEDATNIETSSEDSDNKSESVKKVNDVKKEVNTATKSKKVEKVEPKDKSTKTKAVKTSDSSKETKKSTTAKTTKKVANKEESKETK